MNNGPLLKVLLPLAAAVLLFGTACGGVEEPPPPEATPEQVSDTTPAPEVVAGEPDDGGDTLVVATADAATAAVGQVVRVEGTARNAKLSGVVVASGLHLYCLDQASGWPAELAGQHVAVTGALEFTEEFAATTGPDGAVSAGTDGGVFVIRTCQVQALTP